MASLPSLVPGMTIAVYYSDDTMWHERIVLWQLSPGVWYILTPDLDLYPEDLTLSGSDGPSRLKVKGVDFRYWSRVGGRAYRFAEPIKSDDELKGYIRQAYRDAASEVDFDKDWRPPHVVDVHGKVVESNTFLKNVLDMHRITGKGGKPEQSPSGTQEAEMLGAKIRPIAVAEGDKLWVCLENLDGFRFGQTMRVNPATDLMVDDHTGLVRVTSGWIKVELVSMVDAPSLLEARRGDLHAEPQTVEKPRERQEPVEEGPSDARTLYIDYDAQGVRYKEWRSVCQESAEYSYEDWPHPGPTTVLHLLKHMHKYGGDPKQWLEMWCRQKGISEQDRVKHELRCLMEAFYLGGTFDQLNLPVLGCFETLARRVQCIVDAYAQGAGAPDWGNARLFTGYSGPDDLIMPQLKTWAARKGKEEVELQQARSKMRELRKPSTQAEESAAAAADGSLPAGGKAKIARRPRGKGLEPPAEK